MSHMLETMISKPIYRVLIDITREPRLEVSLPRIFSISGGDGGLRP